MHHPGALDVHPRQCAGHQLRGSRIVGADQAEARRRGIRQWPEQIEHGADAERRANRRQSLHRGVIVRREQEGEAGCREALRRLGLVERQAESECLDEVGAAAAAGNGAIAVLDDRQAAGGRQQRRARRQVETAGGVAARADDVDGIETRRQFRLARKRAHGTGKATDLGRRDAFRAQCGQKRAGHRGCEFGGGQQLQERRSLGFGEVASLHKGVERVACAGHGFRS